MAAHTYWRLRCPVQTAVTELIEVYLQDSSGADLSVGGTASASSNDGPSYVPANAFDRNTGTRWVSAYGTDPDCWIQYQTPTPIDPAKLTLNINGAAPNVVWLEGSDTGSAPWSPRYVGGGRLAPGVVSFDVSANFPTGDPIELAFPQLFSVEDMLSPVGVTVLQDGSAQTRDFVHGGAGVVYGNVLQDHDPTDIPLARRVRLHREVDSMVLRETWSDAAGFYVFPDLNTAYTYFTMAHDHTGSYRDVVANGLVPDLTP